jgi:hypothetical protein
MNSREVLITYLATLAALVLVYIATLVTGAVSDTVLSKLEIFGLGTITGGLIGILRIPSNRNVTVDNEDDDPIPTETHHKGKTK